MSRIHRRRENELMLHSSQLKENSIYEGREERKLYPRQEKMHKEGKKQERTSAKGFSFKYFVLKELDYRYYRY